MFRGMNRSLPEGREVRTFQAEGTALIKGSEARKSWHGALKCLLAGVTEGIGERGWIECCLEKSPG